MEIDKLKLEEEKSELKESNKLLLAKEKLLE